MSIKKQQLYYSQFHEDEWIVKKMGWSKSLPPGIFVDVGSADGITGSNSYYFEKKGWTGLCIDADPRNSKLLQKNRKNVEICAISSKQESMKFYQHINNPTLSGFLMPNDSYSKGRFSGKDYKAIEVRVCTLQSLLEKHKIGSITLLSIDTEGSEIDVWNSFNFEKISPYFIVIEFNDNKEKIIKSMSKQYNVIHQTRANLILMRK